MPNYQKPDLNDNVHRSAEHPPSQGTLWAVIQGFLSSQGSVQHAISAGPCPGGTKEALAPNLLIFCEYRKDGLGDVT